MRDCHNTYEPTDLGVSALWRKQAAYIDVMTTAKAIADLTSIAVHVMSSLFMCIESGNVDVYRVAANSIDFNSRETRNSGSTDCYPSAFGTSSTVVAPSLFTPVILPVGTMLDSYKFGLC